MKQRILFLFLVISCSANAQKLAEATLLFERFEYAQAAQAYEHVSSKKSLELEDYKRLAYSYYSIGDYNKAAPLLDSLVKVKSMDAFFYYAHATVSMSKGDFTTAKSSFLTYKAMDNEFPVDVLVASCDSLLIWKPVELKGHKEAGWNSSKADINGSSFKKGYFLFKEIGIDSAGNELGVDLVDNSEVLLAKPFFVDNQGNVLRINMQDEFKFSVINSATFLNSDGELLLTVAEPLANDFNKRPQHLYTGKFDTISNSIQNLVPWVYSGFEDTTICAHATANKTGNRVVFTKLGKGTNQSDLYQTKFVDGVWSKPIEINNLNTVYNDMFPMFSGDTLLTFSTDGRPGYGSMDIFSSKIIGDEFVTPTHLQAPLNSFKDDFNFIHLNDSSAIYTSNRNGGKGDDDLYLVEYSYEKGPTKEEILAAELDAFIKNWKDHRVYFDFAKFDLKALENFDSLFVELSKFPNVSLLIEGHTDDLGTNDYNDYLGLLRANVIKKELVKRGVAETQIVTVSIGEKDPQLVCEKGCTEEQRAMNRVAIIKLQVNQ